MDVLDNMLLEMGDHGVKKHPVVREPENMWERKARQSIHEAVKILSDVANSRSPKEMADLMTYEISRDHRYLQGEMVEALIGVISRYADVSYDGRNKLAVAECRLLDAVIDTHHLGARKDRS